MSTVRTRGAMLARLERLECWVAIHQPMKLRFGNLRRLPQNYTGERHIVIAKHLPSQSGQEWVEFEEVPGPEPNSPQEIKRGRPDCIDIVYVRPYPLRAEEAITLPTREA